MRCETVAGHPDIVQKLANPFVQTLRWVKTHSPEEIAAKIPSQYAGGDPQLYVPSPTRSACSTTTA